ncbi:hypothetical protein F4777DRAFT_533417 [Nemania sp. FL0916]|nr:hypothetical protein F4777DRAFT_533417 [Nemania sp. FL0916]
MSSSSVWASFALLMGAREVYFCITMLENRGKRKGSEGLSLSCISVGLNSNIEATNKHASYKGPSRSYRLTIHAESIDQLRVTHPCLPERVVHDT